MKYQPPQISVGPDAVIERHQIGLPNSQTRQRLRDSRWALVRVHFEVLAASAFARQAIN